MDDQTAHQPLPVHGYTEQNEMRIKMVNIHKKVEEGVLRLMDNLAMSPDGSIDKRWLAVARTDIERGFMALNRSIFMPKRIEGPLDDTPEKPHG